jgi:SAM-dependent methyltransferase
MNAIVYRAAKAASRAVPKPVFFKWAHQYARWEYHRFLRQRLGVNFVEADSGPPAPPELLLTTRAMSEADIAAFPPDRYLASGYKTIHSWLAMVEPFGFNLRTCGAAFEFGCGSMPFARHLRCVDGMDLVGCDVDPRAIEWCRANLPGITFHHTQLDPPLGFAKDDTFDLVFAASVFTHIPFDRQVPWLRELRRVMRPGGFFICTVEGSYHQKNQLTPENLARLRAEGQFTLDKDNPNTSLSSKVLGQWDVFQTRSRVIRTYGSVFRMRDYIPDKITDVLILQKPRATGDA